MALIPQTPRRLTPYANFRFKVKWDNTYVLGVSKVGGLSRTTQVISHRSGGDPSSIHLAPGQTTYDPISLERGVTYDPAFEQWANKVYDWANSGSATGQNTSLLDFRKDLTIEVYNEAGQKVIAYNVHKAWVSEFNALPELDGAGNALAIQSMVLQHEGWERDTTVTEPDEPSYDLPSS